MPLITNNETFSQTLDVIKSATCDGCKSAIMLPEHIVDQPVRSSWGHMEVTDGLHLTISGGYYSYFDGPLVNVLLCEACSKKMIECFPNFQTLIVSW